MSTSLIKVPAQGQKIIPGQPIPDNPIIPFIEGDGIGVDITPVMQKVVDAAVQKSYGGKRRFLGWRFMPAKRRPVCTALTSGYPPKPLQLARIIQCPSRDR